MKCRGTRLTIDRWVHPAARALTRSDVLIAVVCVLVLLLIGVIILNTAVGPRGVHGVLKDSTHIRGIHQSWLVFAREYDGELPTPSMINRLGPNGIQTTAGKEDLSLNTTANLFSVCILHNYFTPALCIGVNEPNPKVTVCDTYNFNGYNPNAGVYWDNAFTADLQTGSNVSYAHMPIYGKLRAKHWRDSLGDQAWPILGNRGPLNGANDPKSYTFKIHQPFDQWSGNICFADNHTEFLIGLPTAKCGGGNGKTISTQGLFRNDGEDDPDGLLTFTKAMTANGPVIQHD